MAVAVLLGSVHNAGRVAINAAKVRTLMTKQIYLLALILCLNSLRLSASEGRDSAGLRPASRA